MINCLIGKQVVYVNRKERSLSNSIVGKLLSMRTMVLEAVSTQVLRNWERLISRKRHKMAAMVKLCDTTRAFLPWEIICSTIRQARSCNSVKDSPLGILTLAGSAIHFFKKLRLKNLAQHFGILCWILKGGVRDGRCKLSAIGA